MILKVEQAVANGKNKFEIKENNKVKYLAGTPWASIAVPLGIDRIRSCVITKADESLYYATSYSIAENIANTAIPMKWAVTGEQKSHIYNISDNENNNCGRFYKLTNGILNTKYVIEFDKYTLKSYDISIGKTRNVLIYNEDTQIAEIVKPLSVSNNLDTYYIFLLDEYKELEVIISFFTIFFDYQNYANSGEIVGSSEEVGFKYTYDVNNKFYDKNWISNHFNKEEVETIYNHISEHRKNTTNEIKKKIKNITLALIFAWAILFIIAIIVYFSQK